MSTKPETAERAAFEEEYRLMFPASSADPKKFEQNGIGGYEDFQVNNAWRFWQARALLAADGKTGGEPVAWLHKGGHVQVRAPYLSAEAIKGYSTNGQWTPLYTNHQPQAEAVRVPMTRSERAEWWAVAMNAAASLESAASCLRDPDAKKSALGACEHVRQKCNRMWESAPKPQEK